MIISKIEKKLKIKMKNKNLLLQAFTHKSANQKINNEKLEFLGDRVLGLVISKKLIDLYPSENEGVLDKRFAKLVNRKTCALIALSFGAMDFIIKADVKNKISQKDEKILSDSCEAIIGAVYIDKGFNYARDFVLKLWEKDISTSYVTILDAKTKLQEYSLKQYKKLPHYVLISTQGPRHNPIFKISVSIKGSKNYSGFGNSKKNAEQNAAKNLLKSLNLD